MDSADVERDALSIGDYVLFKDVVRQNYLSVEGILQEDVNGNCDADFLQDSIFCVHLQRQYSASRDFNAFLANYHMDPKNIVDEGARKYLQALERGRENERNLNDNYMRKKHGQAVVFGDIIQLFHVKSGKYLTVIPDALANDERDNVKIQLNVNGNAFSWFQVSPRFKIDKDGDRVMSNAEVYLKVAERGNEYIHLADRDPKPDYHREVNCALEATSWRLQIFQNSFDSKDTKRLLISNLVYFNDPETKSNLTIAHRKVESLDDPVSSHNGSLEFFHEFGDAILNPVQEYIDSNLLWLLESSALVKGGPIKWKSDQVRLKHLNTGLYLQQVMFPIEDEEGEPGEKFVLTKTLDAESNGTLFSIHEINSSSKFLGNAKAVQIGSNGVWIERGEVLEDSAFSFSVKGSRDKANALNLIVHQFSSESGVEHHEEDSDGSSADSTSKEPLDVFTGKAIRKFIRKYSEMTVVPSTDAINTVWPTAIRTDMAFFHLVVDKSIFFSQGFPISSLHIQIGVDKGNGYLRSRRQNLLREQGTLEVTMRLIQALIPVTERSEAIKAAAGNRKKKTPSDDEVAMVAMGLNILKKCFELIYYCILDNPENQIYVADFMPVLLAHLNSQPLAGKCVTEMLSKNMELQETKIGTREIQIFVDKLRSSKMNAMYLNLLQSCCSCEGDGVDGNQTKVASMIFSNTNDIIIQLNADYKRLLIVPWDQDTSLYLTPAPVAGSPIHGEPLISKGIPLLSLNWTTNSIDFSPLGLFGKLSVNVEELFKVVTFDDIDRKSMSGGSKVMKSKKQASMAQKAAVANYFIAEMFLGAEMCLDRNYIAMHKLDNLFPYEVLITMLKLNVRNDLKSAAVRLLMCLHIDRDPQAKSKIPCLTRTWSDIKKYSEPQLPFVDTGRRYFFGLLQQLVSDHVKNMAGSRWDELSQHMLKMLKTLVEFNFYGTIDRMQDVVGPLIAALDRRMISYVDPDMALGDSFARNAEMEPSTEKIVDIVGKEEKQQELDTIENSAETIEKDEVKSKFSLSKGFFAFLNIFNVNNAARVLLLDDADGEAAPYTMPVRFTKAPLFELETMVLAVDILAFSQRVIEDRNISVLMRFFYLWESGADSRSPPELFEQAITDSKALTLGIADFDNVMIDVLMFVHTPLVQSTLEVLMAHHSKRSNLLENLLSVQLLASNKKERQFKMVDQMLQQLEQNAETQELWGELETEADYAVSKQTKDILWELTDILRIQNQVLDPGNEFSPDFQMQDLFRNLGCFEICMKVIGLLETVEVDENDELDEKALNTQEICRLCNGLFYWFFMKNPKNQELGYGELEMFLDALDDDVNSHHVVDAIFCGNEVLMRQVPRKYFVEMVDKIVKNGKSHRYLSLFAAIANVGNKNIVENQVEIVMNLTSPGRFQKVACYFFSVHHADYAEKREMMEPLLGIQKDFKLDELPPLLAYHLSLLEVLSRCTVGRVNVTAVEAKVQSVFAYNDIVDSILDEGSILVTRLYMSEFFYNAVIDVELSIPGLELSKSVWKLLDSYREVLANAKNDLLEADSLGWASSLVSSHKIQYILVSIRIIQGFFTSYFDPTVFKDTQTSSKNKEQTNLTKSQVDEIIQDLFRFISSVHNLNSPRLSIEVKENILLALETLKKSSSKLRAEAIKLVDFDVTPPSGAQEKKDDHEDKIIKKLQSFIDEIESDKTVLQKAENENVAFISLLEKLPFIADSVDADVRYESLIRKLVFHIRENIKIVDNQKRMDPRVTTTSRWIVRAFRTMIENRMGMSIYERDDNGGEKQDQAAAPVVNALNTCGATALCLDLIADGIDESLQMEAIKLGVGLLFKEGGALEVQNIMNTHLRKSNSELFFKQVRLTIQKLQAWHNWHQIIELEAGEEPNPPEEILILRMLQLMCEGHYLPNQDIMREQPQNTVSFNLLDDFVAYLNSLSRLPCRTSTCAGIRLTALILEVIQGPCDGNQVHFALNTELVEALNRLNRAKVTHDCVEDEEIELKKTSIDIFQGLVEGQGDKSGVYDRILSIVHLDIILLMSKNASFSGVNENAEPTEEQLILQTECVVLLQTLCNFRPSLYDELGISRRVEDIVGSGTAMIEIIWRNDIHRRFFHVPRICDYLAKSSKDSLVENVDRSTAENKLIDFLNRSHDLYREVKHQQLLTEMNLSRVFSLTNQNRATWISFVLAVILNGFFIADYSYRSGQPEISEWVNNVTTYINAAQTAVAFFTLILWLVVRTPVIYKSYLASNVGRLEAVLYTATDGMTLYYVIYLGISFLGVFVENYYVSLLLLDIVVKDSTTRAVLNAVITPWKALAMGALLQAFVIYIYAFYSFYFFRSDIDDGLCDDMKLCLKFTLSYGFQNGGGIADTYQHTTGSRLIMDLSFFCVVLVILLNVVFGMIIDTFSSLRAERERKILDTNNRCFICGIEKQIFDRSSDEPDGFKSHIKIDHNMWNYLYFIFLLWEQDKDDDDGMEQYVRRAISANEIIFFPANKAVRLEQIVSPTELVRRDLMSSVDVMESNLSSKFDEFHGEISSMLHQLVHSLRQDSMLPLGAEPSTTADITLEFSDEELADDITAITDSSYTLAAPSTIVNTNIELGIVDLKGLTMSVTELLSVKCKIIVNSISTFDINASKVDKNKVIAFENTWYTLPSDVSKVEVSVFNNSAMRSKPALSTSSMGEAKLLASIALNLDQIRQAAGTDTEYATVTMTSVKSDTSIPFLMTLKVRRT